MFDTHIHKPRDTQYVDRNITHHEHRAPTDESIKILREMEEKARDNLILAIRIDDGPIPMAVQVFRDFLNEGCHVAMRLRIGGKEEVVKFHLKEFELNTDLHKFIDEVHDRAFGALVKQFGPALTQALLSRAVKPAMMGTRTVCI